MKLSKLVAVLGFGLVVAACSEAPSGPSNLATVDDGPARSIIGADNPVGAIVLNKGSELTGFCNFAGRVTNEVTLVRNPNGRALLSCHWDNFAGIAPDQAVVLKGWPCNLSFIGSSNTTKSHFVWSPSGAANVSCHFDE